MGCIRVEFIREGRVTVGLRRVGGDISVRFLKVCSTSVGDVVLLDLDGKRLIDSEERILLAAKN